MANTVTVRKIIDGPSKAVIHVYMAYVDTSENSDTVLVDVSDLSGTPSKVTINRVMGNLRGFTGILEFDATTDVPFMSLPADDYFDYCFDHFGGIKDNSGTGSTGDVMITTSGFTAAGDAGWLVIEVKKN